MDFKLQNTDIYKRQWSPGFFDLLYVKVKMEPG